MAALLRCVGLVALACLAASCASLPKPAALPAPTPEQPIQAVPSTPVQAAPTPPRGEQPSALAAPASHWMTNQAALGIIKKAEAGAKVKLTAYQGEGTDTDWYIGYGHKKDVTPGMKITQAQAETFLRDDVHVCESAIVRAVKVPVTENEFSAMVSFCYNFSPRASQLLSLIDLVNASKQQEAAEFLLMYDKAMGKVLRGLTLRRQQEKALFLK
jgi:GH24 family phage-related lysozyme (muramidase)